MTTTFPDNSCDVGMVVAMIGRELGVAIRFFQRIEVRALHVFDDSNFKRFPVPNFENYDRDFMLAGPLGRSPAPFAGDNFEGVGNSRDCPNQNRLNYAPFANRGGEFFEFLLPKILAGIAGVWS